MHRLRFMFPLLSLLTLAWCKQTLAQETLSATRATLEKWVETRQLIAKASSDWQTDKEALGQSIKLFERELKAVEEQLSKVDTNTVQVDKERLQAETQLRASNESLDRTKQFATAFEAQILNLVPQLPQPLQDVLKPLLNRIPNDPAKTRMTAAERTQVIVGILSELDKFNSAIGIFSEKRTNDRKEEVAVETVYVGLGAAYFVNESGDFAGMGSPGPKGWEWTSKPELASSVREIIRIYRNERPARFVPLPATIR